jgi:hypothetical protein
LAAATISGQPDCASTCSQTVMRWALAFGPVPRVGCADAVETATASSAASAEAAM